MGAPQEKRTKRKRDAAADGSSATHHDDAIQELLRKRLEAHLEQALDDSGDESAQQPRQKKAKKAAKGDSEQTAGSGPRQEKSKRNIAASSDSHHAAPSSNSVFPTSAVRQDPDEEFWSSIAKSNNLPFGPEAAPSLSSSSRTGGNASKGVTVVDATKYSVNPVSSATSNERKRFMSADALKVHGGPTESTASGRRRPKKQESFREQLAREVEELGASALTGREKKEYEIKKILRLGGKAPKNIKTPLKILKGMRKKEAERTEKKKQEAIQTGMHIKKKARRKFPGGKDKGLDLTSHAGTFSGGVLRVKKSLIAKAGKGKR